MSDTVEKCHCGQPLHYSLPEMEAYVRAQIRKDGEFIIVHCSRRSWKVQRHYIALHGIKGSELSMLGFEEVAHGQRPKKG